MKYRWNSATPTRSSSTWACAQKSSPSLSAPLIPLPRAPPSLRNPLGKFPRRLLPYLAGLLWLGFDADEDVQLLHERRDALRLHVDVLLNVKH